MLTLEDHISDAVKKFEVEKANPVKTPMNINALDNETSQQLPDVKLFQSLIGTLNYLCNFTRPDIAFAVNVLARRSQDATVSDLNRAKES